ncbi:HYR domain-containing protein [Salinimicrobium terrae]|uniref:HYR domain-containing protein n=1 Tax=Salinimicrobium terrae TaxID=470866 RepID=UPI000491463C|nr:HYR domain-containing protein [Salinimicrobium terrae]
MRRLQTIQKCNSTAVLLRHFFGCDGRKLFFLLLFLFSSSLFAQDGVTITSPETSPTQQNPVPVTFRFDEPISGFGLEDIVISGGELGKLQVTWPDFSYVNYFRLRNFYLNVDIVTPEKTSLAPSKDAVIAIDIDKAGFTYALTLSNGVFKYNSAGVAVAGNPIIKPEALSDARDLAIGKDQKIYIADTGKNQILIFNDSGGSATGNIGFQKLSSPTGLAIGPDNNIYVADTNNDRIVIFNPAGDQIGEINNGEGDGSNQLDDPIRIAVDLNKTIYVSDSGNNRIQIFNSAGEHKGTINGGNSKLNSPGSLVVDEYGYLYVADFAGVDLNVFLDFENITAGDILSLALNLGDLRIQVFNTNNLNETPKTIKDKINIPIDLALKPCGYLAVNNGDLKTEGTKLSNDFPPKLILPTQFIFDLKWYNRLPATFTADLTIDEECKAATINVPPGVGVDVDCNNTPAQASNNFSMVWDKTPPVIDCTPAEVVLSRNEQGKYMLPDYSSRVSDNCDPNVGITQNPSPGEITEGGRVTITAEDAAGNVFSCFFTVKLEAAPQPTFSCPDKGNIPELELDADCNYPQTDFGYLLSDFQNFTDEEYLVQTATRQDNNLEVIIKVYDGENGTFVDECNFTVSLIDNIPPTITCPSPDIVETVPFGETGKKVEYTVPFGDNCTGAAIEQTSGLASGEVFPVGKTITNTFVVTDASGNKTPCSFTVTINEAEDEEDPVITCPPNIEVLTDTGECGAIVEYDFPEASDNAGDLTITIINGGPVSGSFFPVGVTEIEFEARDAADNVDTCILIITVDDEEAPEITTCSPGSVDISAENGQFLVPNLLGDLEAIDNCTGSQDITFIQIPAVGEEIFSDTTLRIFAYDEYDNESNVCTVQLVVDNPDRFINCKTSNIPLGEDGTATLDPVAVYDGNPQDSEIQSMEVEPNFFTCEDLGAQPVELTVYYIDGTSAKCTTHVQVVDEAPPVITCPENSVEFIAAENGKYTVPNLLGEVTALDNCTGAGEIRYAQFPEAGDEILADTSVSIFAYDEYDNESTACAIQLVLMEGEEPLEILCPGDQTESLGANCFFELPDYSSMASVNSATAQVTQEPAAGTRVAGPTEVVLTAVDGSKSATCFFTVEPVDDTLPVFSCREDFELFLNEDGYGIIPAEMLLETVTDNCEIKSVTLSKDRFETSDAGENEVLVTVVDVNGNMDTCEATINVVPYDPERGIECVDSLTRSLDENGLVELSLYYTGEQENIELELSKKDFTCDDIGTHIITATYYGEHTGSCEIEVNIIDDLPPQVNCTTEIDLMLDENGEGEISVNDVNLNSTDNCEIDTMVLSRSNFTSADVGFQTVRFTVTDSSGNSDFCEVGVNVKPYMATSGELNCVEKVTLELNASGEAVLTAQDLLEGNPDQDEFFGEVTYTCEDIGIHYITLSKAGDPSQTCEIELEVVDNIDPVAVCKANFELTLNAGGTATLSAEEFGIASTDNCEIVSMSLDRSTFTTAHLGEQQVVLTVTDSSGNIDTCEATIQVLPNEENPTTVECVDLFTLALNANGTAQLRPQDLFSGGTGGTYTVSQSDFTCEDLGENEVILSFSTINGTGSCTVKVVVEDPLNTCDLQPGPIENDFLIMYPNPSDGLLKFELSPGLHIDRIQVFDMRGRFLLEHSYDNSIPILEYTLNLSEYRAGVYPLLIFTNGREYLERAIIR